MDFRIVLGKIDRLIPQNRIERTIAFYNNRVSRIILELEGQQGLCIRVIRTEEAVGRILSLTCLDQMVSSPTEPILVAVLCIASFPHVIQYIFSREIAYLQTGLTFMAWFAGYAKENRHHGKQKNTHNFHLFYPAQNEPASLIDARPS